MSWLAPRWLVIAALVFLAGCGSASTVTVTRSELARAPAASSCDWRHPEAGCGRVPPRGSCHYRHAGSAILPDSRCTPGRTSPAVSSGSVASTICVRGYTSQVRPPTSYTEPLKLRLMAAYGLTGPLSGYELDHLVPLEAGGAPADPANLWPEPYAGAGARSKDTVENYARRAACAAPKLLGGLQAAIAADWTKVEPPPG